MCFSCCHGACQPTQLLRSNTFIRFVYFYSKRRRKTTQEGKLSDKFEAASLDRKTGALRAYNGENKDIKFTFIHFNET